MNDRPQPHSPAEPLALADWRRQVAEIYASIRHHPVPQQAWQEWRHQRDELFENHSQSPLTSDQRLAFRGLPFYLYDPGLRIMGKIDRQVEQRTRHIDLPQEGAFSMTSVARVHFSIQEVSCSLILFWINAYGGGLFLPFSEPPGGSAAYGGGRYLYDTIKGADLGAGESELVLDFNFAYNPSCAYNEQWVCPLPPPENRLKLPIPAGEQAFYQD